MKSWVFCEDCSWTSTAGALDVAGDGARHERTLGHGVRRGLEVPQDADTADLTGAGVGTAAGGHHTTDGGSMPQNGAAA